MKIVASLKEGSRQDRRHQEAATKARKGINPFTKEPTVFKAKPARKIVRVRALRGLKNFVQ